MGYDIYLFDAFDLDTDYWEPAEGNVRAAIEGLISLDELHPEGIWEGD